MPSQLFATKSIAEIKEADAKGQQLHRTLSATALTLLGIGGIIGGVLGDDPGDGQRVCLFLRDAG